MEDYRDAILDIGETVATMNYAELASSLMDLKTMRAGKEEIAAIESIFLKRAKELGMGQELKGLLRAMQQEVPLPAGAEPICLRRNTRFR